MKTIILFFLTFFVSLSFLSAQSEIWLDDGTVFKISDYQIDSTGIVEIKTDKNKKRYLDTADVFAIIDNEDTTFLYNNPDYPLKRAKMFVKGEIDGKKYKNYYVYAGGFLTGAAIPYTLSLVNISSFFSPVFSVIYVFAFSPVNTNSKFCDIPENLKNNEDYINGYKVSASKKKITNTAIFSVVGLATGFAIVYFIGN